MLFLVSKAAKDKPQLLSLRVPLISLSLDVETTTLLHINFINRTRCFQRKPSPFVKISYFLPVDY